MQDGPRWLMQLSNPDNHQPDEDRDSESEGESEQNDVDRGCRLGEEELGIAPEEAEHRLRHSEDEEHNT